MPVHSREIGISGECDVVEFYRSEKGVSLSGKEGRYQPVPVEYKRGSPKATDVDALQLAAQALCLEEMLCCDIPYGYIYYGETRHRKKIEFQPDLRAKVRDMFLEMHKYYDQRYTPKVKWSKSCNACSLKDLCMPVLNKNLSAASYIENRIFESGDPG